MNTATRHILSLLAAAAVTGGPLSARQEPDEPRPRQEEPKKKQEPQSPEKAKPKEQPKQEPAPPAKQPEQKKQKEPGKENNKQQREQDKKANATAEKDAGRGKKIPQQKFQTSFGPQHHFHVRRSGGDNRRFQSGGYVFEVVDLWPVGWSFDDECYVLEDGDDYYLVDVVHPELRVIVIVVGG